MPCRVIEHNSPDYRRAVELRRVVLRFPLGMDYTEEQLASENDSAHFILEEGDQVLASALMTPYDDQTVKVRQVAVDPDTQGKGLGRTIMLFAEDWAKNQGFQTAILHARQVAVDFYLKIGYEIYDEPFEEVGIPHRKMRKSLI